VQSSKFFLGQNRHAARAMRNMNGLRVSTADVWEVGATGFVDPCSTSF
jgi:hypothetical protein